MPNDVLCYGDIALDNVMHVSHFPTPERSVVFHRESYHIGGTICNSAVCLASWGVPTTMALSYDLGEDDYADQLLKLLSAFPALDLSLARRSPNTVTPYCRVLVIPDGERALLNYRYSEKADHELSIDLHRGEKYLIASIYGLARRFAALRAFRERGVTTVMGDIYWPDYPDLREIDIIINSASTPPTAMGQSRRLTGTEAGQSSSLTRSRPSIPPGRGMPSAAASSMGCCRAGT